MNIVSNGISNCISYSNSNTIPLIISEHTEAISMAIPNSSPKTICNPNSNNLHYRKLLREGCHWQLQCKVVSMHLSSLYIAHADISISSHIGSKFAQDWNWCYCCSRVDTACDVWEHWLWIGEHMWDSRDTRLIQNMQELTESHPFCTRSIVFSIICGLGSRFLFSHSLIESCFEGDDWSTCRYIVLGAFSIIPI